VDWVVDERRDPFKAAAAAATYLKHLYKKYGDWYLALAAYNGGTRRLDRAIRRLKTKDFFKIAKHRWYIRRETRNYVPAFLAALMIAKIPEKYGFTVEPDEKIFENTKTVQTPSPVSLKDMASLTGVPYSTLQ
jgi:membrane-bound lytic murein transglycosylase D